MRTTVSTWADGFGRWHAKVEQAFEPPYEADQDMARAMAFAAINHEIQARESGWTERVTLVERKDGTKKATWVFAEAGEELGPDDEVWVTWIETEVWVRKCWVKAKELADLLGVAVDQVEHVMATVEDLPIDQAATLWEDTAQSEISHVVRTEMGMSRDGSVPA